MRNKAKDSGFLSRVICIYIKNKPNMEHLIKTAGKCANDLWHYIVTTDFVYLWHSMAKTDLVCKI
jgi:hypothetical protein